MRNNKLRNLFHIQTRIQRNTGWDGKFHLKIRKLVQYKVYATGSSKNIISQVYKNVNANTLHKINRIVAGQLSNAVYQALSD